MQKYVEVAKKQENNAWFDGGQKLRRPYIIYISPVVNHLYWTSAQYKFSTGRHPYDKNSPPNNFIRGTLAVLLAYFA